MMRKVSTSCKAANQEMLKALKALVRRSDNGDVIEPGWYEIEDARKAIARAEGKRRR